MHTYTLDNKLATQLASTASQIGKTEDDCLRIALLNFLEDQQDIARAKQVIEADAKEWTQEEIERDFGLDC